MGGLGNQMFQYAAGRALSEKHRVPLKLDLSYLKREWLERLKGNTIRRYSLGIFNIEEEFAKPYELPALNWIPWSFLTNPINQLRKFLKPSAPFVLSETPFNPEENQSNLQNGKPHVYLDGFWQSEEYFKEIKDIIVEDFDFKIQPEGLNLQFAQKIAAHNSVSLHIRHGDYLTNPHTHNFHGVCPLQYYLACINKIKDQVKNPLFFVFGDDLEWAKKNLGCDDSLVYVEHNVGTSNYYEDLRLVSLCQHNIIANSTFSWWGAYLNQNPQKIVFAPKPWIKARHNAPSVVPVNWIEIKTQLE